MTLSGARNDTAGHEVADLQRSDLRAAFMLRNTPGVPLRPKTADGLATLASRMNVSRDDLIERALSEWLETRLMDPVPGDDLIHR
ncbi:ribbon-helix-helix protein, CopG family [Mesorhizobium sp. B2-7-3]|nr:ribbon-helix-helix protein, CopG family [Mesorhizobium sp. B2-7-3]